MRLSRGLLAAVVLLATAGLSRAQPLGCACGPISRPASAEERFGIFNASGVPGPREIIDEVLHVASGAQGRTPAAAVVRRDHAATRTQAAGAVMPLLAAGHGNRSQRPAGSLDAAVPEPADWMMLVCGLVVGAFIARRKASWTAD